ncbi:MAG: DUF4389 domain-containing protein [Deltaproteobacteria bacterium]|nr:DUF4389 domain-containing protein [Deltaproteobacteria bacterium]MBW2317090.1 DUF4389 domain-containing protein [Deltaproteobacteria bacterium]MBW2600432.1 DUF4389 domain-containing protein [Deltaproteobacteria bacterium]OEU46613.1 MAG: glucose-1-phosphate thymidylyltransferase [Desulfobacterales bacterium S7086C20]
MDSTETTDILSRKRIAIRFLYTIFFVLVLEILKIIIQLSVLFQYVYLFITTDYNNPVRNLSNKVAAYAYKVMRYVTLNENQRPFPFSEFPQEIDQPESEATFE